ncbi:MAG TPA: PLP-dependent aspartate aminotransferase family protein [Candidatus Caenarcaniphilales bacterium]|nr:PLP-dependent aspartate aminotransferase family protein [Candidatus Caenarcaniphilales bacterium]
MSHEQEPRAAGFGTRAIRAASRPPRVDQTPDSVPIYQAVTFSSRDAADLGDVLADRRSGYAYARIDNPTASALAAAVAELEGAEAGYAFASGMAAIHASLVSLVGSGDHVVATRAVYGSSHHLLDGVLRRFGVETTFVDSTDADGVEAAFTPQTRVLYLETISNPTIVVSDLADLTARAHRRGVAVVVDNTFASPYLCRPIELGADLVIESCTKWLGGHSDVLAGVVVGDRRRIAAVKDVQIDTGGTAAPFSSFLVLRGIETLHVRLERHSSSALALSRHLERAAGVVRVYYPGLPSHPQFAIAQRMLRSGGGMLALELEDRIAAEAFLDALELPARTASLGSVHTICVHPPSTTHRQLSEAQLSAAGIPSGLVRVSVGLEDPEDLIADFEAGMSAASSASEMLRTGATPPA